MPYDRRNVVQISAAQDRRLIPDRRTQWRGGRRASDFDETARQLAARVLAEYAEQPGLSLTLEQTARLFGTDAATCASVLLMLARHRLLATTPTGQFVKLPGPSGEIRIDSVLSHSDTDGRQTTKRTGAAIKYVPQGRNH